MSRMRLTSGKPRDVASAQAHIDGWGTRTQALNEKVGSAKVADAVTSLEGLKASVDQVFQGQNQASRQKVLSKTFNAEGYDGRRAGNHIY